MRAGNLDVHRRLVEAVNDARVPRELLAPDFVLDHRASAVTDRRYRGKRGWQEWTSDLFEVFADGARYGVEELLAVGEGCLAARYYLVGRGARTGNRLELRWAGAMWFQGGRAIRATAYASRVEAVGALGSSLQAVPASAESAA